MNDNYQIVSFGNVCVGAGGGLTKGYWANKGQKLITPELLLMLAGLNLRDGYGNNYDPVSAADLSWWLSNASATNMAYMLSAQLTAMELNVATGKVDTCRVIWVGSNDYLPGTLGINVVDLMNLADNDLAVNSYTVSGNPDRAYQEFLKDALDGANNNQNFVQPIPLPFTFPDSL